MIRILIILYLFLTSLVSSSQKGMRDVFLKKEFISKNMNWPPKNVFIRVFKYDKELEVWTTDSTEYSLFKKYKICLLSGDLGPKRKEGDLQVPEGFYYINDFNYYSNYYLSLGVDYPNKSDRILSEHKNLGGLIYIHGACVSVGCIDVGNDAIDEIYTLCRIVKNNGQDSIPVHIFPVNYSNLKSLFYLDFKLKNKPQIIEFEKNIFDGYNFFEENKILPYIFIDDKGVYNYL
jgi:murein L,D-transpeptidase YafK